MSSQTSPKQTIEGVLEAHGLKPYKEYNWDTRQPITKGQLDKWLAQLRSGKLTQGKGGLHIIDCDGNESYCCLGVLAAKACYRDKDYTTAHGMLTSVTGENNYKLPPELQKVLAHLNDTVHLNFFEIADLVEEVFQGYE